MAEFSFLGRGWDFPFKIGVVSGTASRSGTSVSDDIERIKDSLSQILGTRLNERFMRRDFGNDAWRLGFANAQEQEIRSKLQIFVLQAITKYEKRINLAGVSVRVDPSEKNVVLIDIQFLLRGSNQPGNYVYPFYLEGLPREHAVE